MSLKILVNDETTDKNSVHSYLETYEELFHKKQNENINILEIGVYQGGSIKLWKDYFINGTVYGVDICGNEFMRESDIVSHERVKLYLKSDAYSEEFVREKLSSTAFDFLVDDGPHTLESMKFFIKHYSPLLKDDGILIIEDIQEYDWIQALQDATPEHLKPCVNIYDLRHVKNRYDDIMFVINKSVSF
jgi:hypothetical protein